MFRYFPNEKWVSGSAEAEQELMCASPSGPLASFVSVKHLPSNRVAPGVSS